MNSDHFLKPNSTNDLKIFYGIKKKEKKKKQKTKKQKRHFFSYHFLTIVRKLHEEKRSEIFYGTQKQSLLRALITEMSLPKKNGK